MVSGNREIEINQVRKVAWGFLPTSTKIAISRFPNTIHYVEVNAM
jgi:hypothetical protein